MENPYTLTLALFLGACGCLLIVTQRQAALELPTGVLLKLSGFGVLVLALAMSDYPASWRLGDVILYLTELSFQPFRVLVVLATGAAMFASVLGLLYWAGQRK